MESAAQHSGDRADPGVAADGDDPDAVAVPHEAELVAYSGLAVVMHTSAEHDFDDGRPVRRKRAPRTRGLNRNYNRVLKDVFKGAALVALGRPGALQDLYEGMLSRGMRAERARVTLARKIAALTLRLWKEGEVYDAAKLKQQET